MLYDDKEFIGKKIKQLRINAKYSQADLSEKIGMTEKNLSNIERGLQFPTLNSFLKLLDFLKVPISEFGINSNESENTMKNFLIKEICLANEKELEAYYIIVNAIKNLNKKSFK